MTTWSLMIISNGMLTTCPILRAPEIQAPRHVIGLPLDGHIIERPNAMNITCHISASSNAMVALSKLASTPMTWPTCYITTMWPRAKISRSASGRWKIGRQGRRAEQDLQHQGACVHRLRQARDWSVARWPSVHAVR